MEFAPRKSPSYEHRLPFSTRWPSDEADLPFEFHREDGGITFLHVCPGSSQKTNIVSRMVRPHETLGPWLRALR